MLIVYSIFFFFFKQKTAYEMRISDWSSDVCSSDLTVGQRVVTLDLKDPADRAVAARELSRADLMLTAMRPSALVKLGLDELTAANQIGRASCRERVCQYV